MGRDSTSPARVYTRSKSEIVLWADLPSGDIWQYLKTFLVVITVGEGDTGVSRQKPGMLLHSLQK